MQKTCFTHRFFSVRTSLLASTLRFLLLLLLLFYERVVVFTFYRWDSDSFLSYLGRLLRLRRGSGRRRLPGRVRVMSTPA